MSAAARNTAQQQEALVLDAAIACIAESSLLDFTMAAIAKRAGLSVGSVYKHVQSKEDVLVAIAQRMMTQQHLVSAEVLSLPLTTPERLVGTFLIAPVKLYVFPFGVHLDMLIGNEAVLERASTRWLEQLKRLDQLLDEVFHTALIESWERGELLVEREERDRTLEELSVGLWSMCVGFIQVAHQRHARNRSSVESALPFPLALDHELVKGAHRLINSYPWKTPLDNAGVEKVCALLQERGYR